MQAKMKQQQQQAQAQAQEVLQPFKLNFFSFITILTLFFRFFSRACVLRDMYVGWTCWFPQKLLLNSPHTFLYNNSTNQALKQLKIQPHSSFVALKDAFSLDKFTLKVIK